MATSTGSSGDMTNYEVYLVDAPSLILDAVGDGSEAMIMHEDSTYELDTNVPET